MFVYGEAYRIFPNIVIYRKVKVKWRVMGRCSEMPQALKGKKSVSASVPEASVMGNY